MYGSLLSKAGHIRKRRRSVCLKFMREEEERKKILLSILYQHESSSWSPFVLPSFFPSPFPRSFSRDRNCSFPPFDPLASPLIPSVVVTYIIGTNKTSSREGENRTFEGLERRILRDDI